MPKPDLIGRKEFVDLVGPLLEYLGHDINEVTSITTDGNEIHVTYTHGILGYAQRGD